MNLKVKICGMREASDIKAVTCLNPDYLGFIFYPQSPRFVSEIYAEFIKSVPNSIKTTGVFVNQKLSEIQSTIAANQLKAVQLHGKETVADCEVLKAQGIEVIKSFGISASFDFSKPTAYQNAVDYFLFDTQTKAYGGSGMVFDWALLSRYRLEKPYFLSGGIGLEQLSKISQINDHRFYALDVNSKFEIEPGMKELSRVEKFISQVRNYHPIKQENI